MASIKPGLPWQIGFGLSLKGRNWQGLRYVLNTELFTKAPKAQLFADGGRSLQSTLRPCLAFHGRKHLEGSACMKCPWSITANLDKPWSDQGACHETTGEDHGPMKGPADFAFQCLPTAHSVVNQANGYPLMQRPDPCGHCFGKPSQRGYQKPVV